MFTENANRIFNRSIEEYHRWDDVDHPIDNPYAPGTIDHLLYHKNWIDTVQWHLEDIIRDPAIDPAEALLIKRRIDKSNQDRTDMVEYVDSYLLDKYKDVTPAEGARLNTETPAWAIDRLSILALKIYHMAREAERTDVDDAHRAACRKKLDVLLAQQVDLPLRVLEVPVEVIDLQLAEFHCVPVDREEALNDCTGAVGGEAEMTNASVFLLCCQVVVNPVSRVEILIDVQLADIVDQIEVKILHAAFFKLFLEDLLDFVHVGQVVAGKLVGQIKAFPRMSGQGPAQDQLRVAAVVAPGGVVIVDSALHGAGDHFVDQLLIHARIVAVDHGQPHGAHAERRKL